MSKVIEIKDAADLQSVLDNHDDVVVEFGASWCQPCHRLAPHFEKAADRLPEVVFAKIDVDELPAVTNEYGIMSVPTILRFRGDERGVVAGRSVVQLVNELRE